MLLPESTRHVIRGGDHIEGEKKKRGRYMNGEGEGEEKIGEIAVKEF